MEIDDASHANSRTSYAIDGVLTLLMEDHDVQYERSGQDLTDSQVRNLSGYGHPLLFCMVRNHAESVTRPVTQKPWQHAKAEQETQWSTFVSPKFLTNLTAMLQMPFDVTNRITSSFHRTT